MSNPPDKVSPQELARRAVEAFVREGRILEAPSNLEGVLADRAGTFVTLRSKDGSLRGCIGTIEPARVNLAEEIIQNAVGAASHDPRFPPVKSLELEGMIYGVDVLSPPEDASGPEDLDPARFGVIIETKERGRRALLLPGIEGLETVEQQWRAIHIKAGIQPGTPVKVKRFTVTRFGKD